jgi:flagellar export protein FliJ
MKAQRRVRRYDDLLRLRKRQEDIKAQVYANAIRSIRLAKGEKNLMEERRIALFTESEVAEGSVIDMEMKRKVQQYERHLARAIVEQDALIHERTVDTNAKRDDMTESVKLRRMMETLLEHSRNEVSAEYAKQERLNIDEVASVRAALKLKS